MRTLGPVCCLLLALVAFPASGQDDYGDEYGDGDFARVRFADSGVSLIRGRGAEPGDAGEAGSINAPVFAGDTVRTSPDQRVEIELAGGTLVRIDRGSDILFQALPRPYAGFVDNTVLAVQEGAVRIDAVLEGEETFRIDTPAASVYLLGNSDVRIDVNDRGRTVVSSYRGVAEVAGDQGSILVRSGMRSVSWPDGYPEDPAPFNTLATDAFDRWVERRDDGYAVRDGYSGGYDDVPEEIRPYYGELSAHGSWVVVEPYGYVWRPTAVGTGWRPYLDGYWHYGPSGYFWVSYEPWGWAPYHYGRWSWLDGYGWCWAPGRVFGGAWVAWSWGSAYVGWSPLGYWDLYPVGWGNVGLHFYHSDYWTFVHYDNFWYRHYDRYGHYRYNPRYGHHGHHGHNYRRYAVPVDSIGHGVGDAVVTRPPRVAPEDLARDPSLRERIARDTRSRRDLTDGAVADRAGARPRGRSFRDLEAGVIGNRRASGTAAANRPARDRGPRTLGMPDVRAGADRGARSPARGGSRRDSDAPSVRNPRITPGVAGTGRASASTRGRRDGVNLRSPAPRAGSSGSSPSARPRRVSPGESGGNGVRDLYRGLSRTPSTDDGTARRSPATRSAPRTRSTEERATTPRATPRPRRSESGSSARPSTPRRVAPRTPERRSPQAAPRDRKESSSVDRSRRSAPSRTPRVTPRSDTRRTPQAAPRAAPRSTPRVSPRSTPRTAPGTAPRVSPRSTPRSAPRAAPRPAPRSTPRAAPRSAPRTAPRAAPRAAPRPAPRSTPRAAPRSAPRSAPKAAPRSGGSKSRPSGRRGKKG